MSKELHDYELRYSLLENKGFSLIIVISHFRPYIVNSPAKAYVPHPLVNMMLSQPFREVILDNWLEKLQEFDIEARPLKEVKGKRLCKLITRFDVVNLLPQAIITTQYY